MPGLHIARQLLRMRRDWDRRARENARHYVVTGQPQWSDEEFFQSGRIALEEDILNDLENICQGRRPKDMKVLEIGCCAGRVTRALAQFFGDVYAVDISREMVRQAQRAVSDFPNARVFRNNGKDLSALSGPWWRLGTGRPLQVDSRSRPWCFNTSRAARLSRTMRAKYTGSCGPARYSNSRCRAATTWRANRKTVGWGSLSPNRKPAGWRSAAVSKCAIRLGREISTTGSGSSRNSS